MLVYSSYPETGETIRVKKTPAREGRTSSAAFAMSDTLALTVSVPRVFCASSASLCLYRDEDMRELAFPCEAVLPEEEGCDDFSLSLDPKTLAGETGGLFYYCFRVETPYGSLFFDRDGCAAANAESPRAEHPQEKCLTADGQRTERPQAADAETTAGSMKPGADAETDSALTAKQPESNAETAESGAETAESTAMPPAIPPQVSRMQLTFYEDGFDTPRQFAGEMMYQIFPDRFSDGGRPIPPDGGRTLETDWEHGVPQYAEVPGGEVANDVFFGGNLWGVAEKLDEIASLGCGVIYLNPIFEAASNHKYDTGDYMTVDRSFGGDEALEHLIGECHKRGMKLILDGVFNHTGADSRYFNRFGHYPGAGAYGSKHSKYYRWYTFDEYPDRYRAWWGVEILPAVKSGEPSYLDFICGEHGVARHWLRKGIDGWRLDVADELSDVFLDRLRDAVKTEKSEAIVLGEVWEDASNKVAYDKRRRYFRGRQLDSVMNYPLKEAVIDAVLTRDVTRLRRTATELYTHYPRCVGNVLMNFLGTHDTERILTVLAGAGSETMTNRQLASFKLSPEQRRMARERLKLAWGTLAMFPGMPCIYYGDEIGMEGGRDPFNRMPYPKKGGDAELKAFYRLIGSFRRLSGVFADGELEMPETFDAHRLLIVRRNEKRLVCAALNLGESDWTVEFDSPACDLMHGVVAERFTQPPLSVCWYEMG